MIYKTLHRRIDNTMAKRKRTNNDLQNITQKAKDFPTFSCSSKNGLLLSVTIQKLNMYVH